MPNVAEKSRYGENHTPPIVIMTMLHIYAIAEPLDTSTVESPARAQALRCLLDGGLIVHNPRATSGFSSTRRGDAWVAALCRSDWPEA